MSATKRGLTYREAGVDIDAADKLVSQIGRIAKTTRRPEVVSGVGPFAAAVSIPKGFRDPLLLSSADGVGTKLDVARLARRHDTIGIDLVAMNVNDLLTAGARPLFFLDYVSAGQLSSIDVPAIISGIAAGCKQSAMSLVGGETAELPGFYAKGTYDLAGFCVGVAERRRLVTGARIRPGDCVIGLASDGLHSNGFSLARRALGITTPRSLARRPKGFSTSLGEELLRPTKIYVKPVLAALEAFDIRGMAHITGGGLAGNLSRVLPKGVAARIDRGAIARPPIFDLIAKSGGVPEREMEKTFNLGVGFVLILPRRQAESACKFFRRRRVGAAVIGETFAGKRRVSYANGF